MPVFIEPLAHCGVVWNRLFVKRLTSSNEIWWNRPKQVSGANQNIFRSYRFFGIWTFVMKFLENSSIEILWKKTINQIVAWGVRGAHTRAHLHTLTHNFKLFKNIYLMALPKAKISKIFLKKSIFKHLSRDVYLFCWSTNMKFLKFTLKLY